MLVLQIYGHVCRVCLEKANNLISLNETNEEYSQTIMELLHQFIPGLEAGSAFPVPQEICELCRDQLLTAYRFQQKCKATNAEMYKMWLESQQQQKVDTEVVEEREQEIKLIEIVESCKELDPIKLEGNTNEKHAVEESERNLTTKNDCLLCSLCLKRCRTKDMLQEHKAKCHKVVLHEDGVDKEDDEDDKPLISLRSKSITVNVEISTKKELVTHFGNESPNSPEEDNMKQMTKTIRNHCSKCNKNFKYAHHLLKHKCKPISKQLHTCEMCSKQFASANLMQKHVRNKHKDILFPLTQTTKELKAPVNMQRNAEGSLGLIANDSNSGIAFETDNGQEDNYNDFRESDSSISDNVEDEDENNERCTAKDQSSTADKHLKYACTECNASFRFEKQLERHLKKHTDAHRFVCPVCSDRFKYPFMLHNHMEKHHSEGESKIPRKVQEVKKGPQEKSHSCNYCSAAYTNVGGLAQHMSKKHSDIVPFKCDKCDKTFVVEEHLKIHTNRHMGIKNFKCDLCDKSFSFKFAMKQHMRIHTGDLNYLCTLCGKKFYRPSNLRQHMQRHGDDKPYTCPHCLKRFKCPSDRYIHLMSHQEGKNHVCSTCGSRFSRVDTLHQHQILHTGEKPYKCDQCPMAFPRLMNLNRHLRTHTGEKPYKCKYCDKAYAQSNDLNKHLRTHVGENTYMCSQCPSAFKYQADLRSHDWEHYRKQKQEEAERTLGKEDTESNTKELKDAAVSEENM